MGCRKSSNSYDKGSMQSFSETATVNEPFGFIQIFIADVNNEGKHYNAASSRL